MSTVHKEADCIISGGTIRTMDPQLPEAEAVAILGERIVFVGDLEQARELAGHGTKTIDLRGKVALPGFVESHSHPILFGRYLEEVDCRNCSSLKEVTEALRKEAKETPPGQWVVGNGYDDTLLKELRHPTRHELDQASREHPILLRHISVHNVVVGCGERIYRRR